MNHVEILRHKAIIQISTLMLIFLTASSIANAIQERYTFVILYILSFITTYLHLRYYKKQNDSDKAATRLVAILYLLFFSFFFIGKHETFDILWVLLLPILTVILGDYQSTKRWLILFNALILLAIVINILSPTTIEFGTFSLWSMLWAGIFISGMVIYYKQVQRQLQTEIDDYQKNLEEKIQTAVNQLQTLHHEKEQADNLLLQSRLRSLETQLNPHFLFNALNSAAELTHQNPQKAEDTMLKISSFLRNTMKEETDIAIEKELANVQAYVELENIRFSNRIKCTVTAPLPKWRVPKFSIQLLVENAIKHGFSVDLKTLDIIITFDTLLHTINVQNNGKPMVNTTFGIGLSNLHERLQLLCNGTLSISQVKPPKFTITLGESNENITR